MAPGLFHLEAQAQRRPEHPALVFHDPETGPSPPISYAALNDEVNQVAQGLRSLGLPSGSGVAALTGTHREALVLYFAAMRLGLWYTPLNTHLKAQEIGQIVEDAEAEALFYRPAFAGCPRRDQPIGWTRPTSGRAVPICRRHAPQMLRKGPPCSFPPAPRGDRRA